MTGVNYISRFRYIWPCLYLFILLVYVLFPAHMHSPDAWAYATYARYGHHLFAPHHLLYTATVYIIYTVLNLFVAGADALATGILINAIAAWLCLFPLRRIFRLLQCSEWRQLGLLCIAAFSFGVWRFASENETYTIPLLLSLWASYFYIQYWLQRRLVHLFYCSLFGIMACLYHQMHIFWWLGFLFGVVILFRGKALKPVLLYSLPVILLPLVYGIVLVLYEGGPLTISAMWQYVLHDVYSGAVGAGIGPQHFLLGGINLVRSFYQVHGSVKVLLLHLPLYFIPASVSVIAAAAAIYYSLKGPVKFKVRPGLLPLFITFLSIFLLQWAFALYNVGNAEFMAMLPALLAILVACMYNNARALVLVATSLFCWNFFLAILPAHYYKSTADEAVAHFVSAHAQAKVMVAEPQIVNNIIYYRTNTQPANIIRAPGYYRSKYGSTVQLKRSLDSTLREGIAVYTDVTGRPALLSRAYLLYHQADQEFMQQFRLLPVDSFPVSGGWHVIHRLQSRESTLPEN